MCAVYLRLTSAKSVPCADGDTSAGVPTSQQAVSPPQESSQGVLLQACLRPLKTTVSWTEGSVTAASLQDVHDIITPMFRDLPGFKSAVVQTSAKTSCGSVSLSAIVCFDSVSNADAARHTRHQSVYKISNPKTSLQLDVSCPRQQPPKPKDSGSSSSSGGAPDPELEITEVDIIRNRADGPEGRASFHNRARPVIMATA